MRSSTDQPGKKAFSAENGSGWSCHWEDGVAVLEGAVPGVLERREHRRVGLDRVRQLVEDQHPALIADGASGGVPELGPAAEDRGVLERHGAERGEQLPALERRRLLLRGPVGGRQPALLRPVQQQAGLADAAPAVEQQKLGRPRATARGEVVEKREFLLAVDKHGSHSI
jgi:hypothetical protein